MFIPPQRIRPKSSSRTVREVPPFRRWVKKRHCSVKGCPNVDIDPAHVRCDLPADALKGGTSLKPHDIWIIPLCRMHHDEQHKGERSFALKYKLEPVALAQLLFTMWLKTPSGQAWKRKMEEA